MPDDIHWQDGLARAGWQAGRPQRPAQGERVNAAWKHVVEAVRDVGLSGPRVPPGDAQPQAEP